MELTRKEKGNLKQVLHNVANCMLMRVEIWDAMDREVSHHKTGDIEYEVTITITAKGLSHTEKFKTNSDAKHGEKLINCDYIPRDCRELLGGE